jgi:hypothetical protein
MEELKKLVIESIMENLPSLKVVCAFIAYSILEYYFGKTDRVKEGSLPEFVWARVKGLFYPSKGIPNEPKS